MLFQTQRSESVKVFDFVLKNTLSLFINKHEASFTVSFISGICGNHRFVKNIHLII